jgi:hypothetical protein
MRLLQAPAGNFHRRSPAGNVVRKMCAASKVKRRNHVDKRGGALLSTVPQVTPVAYIGNPRRRNRWCSSSWRAASGRWRDARYRRRKETSKVSGVWCDDPPSACAIVTRPETTSRNLARQPATRRQRPPPNVRSLSLSGGVRRGRGESRVALLAVQPTARGLSRILAARRLATKLLLFGQRLDGDSGLRLEGCQNDLVVVFIKLNHGELSGSPDGQPVLLAFHKCRSDAAHDTDD